MKPRKKYPTAELLNTLFSYNKENGEIYWKKCREKKNIGKKAGSVVGKGYRYVTINGVSYYIHRIIWFFENNKWPEKSIDHINGDISDNRIENLRDVSNRENASNKQAHRDGKLVGAIFDKWSKGSRKWKSRIQENGKVLYLGAFKTEIEAHKKYIKYKNEKGLI